MKVGQVCKLCLEELNSSTNATFTISSCKCTFCKQVSTGNSCSFIVCLLIILDVKCKLVLLIAGSIYFSATIIYRTGRVRIRV